MLPVTVDGADVDGEYVAGAQAANAVTASAIGSVGSEFRVGRFELI
jgi:hypothetical protein